MTHVTIERKALQTVLEAHQAMREWIDAVPDNTVLPAMPGCDGDWLDTVEANLKQALEQPVQEPYGYVSTHTNGLMHFNKTFQGVYTDTATEIVAVHTNPPAAPVPLTDEQREEIAKGWRGRNWTVGDIIDATEAAHGITKGQR